MPEQSTLPTPREMIAHLDRYVFGQARAKQDLAVAVYQHYLSQAYRAREGHDLGRHHLLMIGPTGVGKTLLVKTLAAYLGVPVGFSSAAGLVESGYKGNSVESVIKTLLDRAGGDPKKAEKGIVFIDEIDKIRVSGGGHRDVSGEGVQNALLTLLDGRSSEGLEGYNHAEVDTGRLLFICAGAFVDLAPIVETRLGSGRSRIGFHARPEELDKSGHAVKNAVYETLCQAQTADLVKYGMIPEFIGRFASLTVLHELLRSDLRTLLSSGLEQTPLERQKCLAGIHGIQLEIEDAALDAVCREAEILGTGARGLSRLLNAALARVEYRWPELADDGVTRVVITAGCVTHGHEPQLVKEDYSELDRIDHELRKESISGLPPPQAEKKMRHHVGLTDTSGWSERRYRQKLDVMRKEQLGWAWASESTRRWWMEFEAQNSGKLEVLFRLADELRIRSSTITDFHHAYLTAKTQNTQAVLHFLDYERLRRSGGGEDEHAEES